MARIPEAEIERLKKEVAIERLVMGFGVELKRHGAELVGTCPFHADKTPSLVVSPKTNLWHCLGKCNVGGSTIDWVMRTKGVSFRHAVELLRADHPSLAAGDGHVVKKGTTAKLEAPVSADAEDHDALRQVVDFYHATLKESPEALRYLESRGLQQILPRGRRTQARKGDALDGAISAHAGDAAEQCGGCARARACVAIELPHDAVQRHDTQQIGVADRRLDDKEERVVFSQAF